MMIVVLSQVFHFDYNGCLYALVVVLKKYSGKILTGKSLDRFRLLSL
jgi:hypothetical protein